MAVYSVRRKLLPGASKQPLHSDSNGAQFITLSLEEFKIKDMESFAVVQDAGFWHLLSGPEPGYIMLMALVYNVVCSALYVDL